MLFKWKDMPWFEAKMRKRHSCWRCCGRINKGDNAYRPISNGNHRMRRLCVSCAVNVVRLLEQEANNG